MADRLGRFKSDPATLRIPPFEPRLVWLGGLEVLRRLEGLDLELDRSVDGDVVLGKEM